MNGSRAEHGNFFHGWLADPDHQIGFPEGCCAVSGNPGSSSLISGIGMITPGADPGFHGDVRSESHQFFDGGGIKGGTGFDRVGL